MASWSNQPPVKLGGSLSSCLSGPFLLWIEDTSGLYRFVLVAMLGLFVDVGLYGCCRMSSISLLVVG